MKNALSLVIALACVAVVGSQGYELYTTGALSPRGWFQLVAATALCVASISLVVNRKPL
jgi:hypothetical protein